MFFNRKKQIAEAEKEATTEHKSALLEIDLISLGHCLNGRNFNKEDLEHLLTLVVKVQQGLSTAEQDQYLEVDHTLFKIETPKDKNLSKITLTKDS